MNEPTMVDLARRLERLEKTNRRMKRLGCLIFGGFAIALMMGQSQCNTTTFGTKVVVAHKFIIRDANGKSRVELDETGFTLTDAEGDTLVSLLGSRTAAKPRSEFVHFRLFGSNGSIELSSGSVSMDKNPLRPYLMVSDKDGNAKTFISPADVNLWYGERQRAGLIAGNSGTSISFYDPADIPVPRVELGLDANGGSLSLADKNNKARAVLGSTSLVSLRSGEKTITPEESLTLFDKDGKVSWQAPR